jgi:DNA/RNA endonuclease YhcR with UshA esterase domain
MRNRLNLKARLLKTTLALALALPLQTTITSGLQQAWAEGPSDPAPFLNAKVVNENAGKKILFDNTHGQTAGAADWVIDGAFSDFANGLADNGYYVKELRKTAPITIDDLQGYDVFVIGEANIPYKQTEQAAMQQYVQNGGSIFFIADHYNADRNKNRWDASEVMNGYRRGAWSDPAKGMSTDERNSAAMQGVASSDWLNANFGVRFRYNALGDIVTDKVVTPDQALGITSGVSTVAMHAGATIEILDPTKAKGIVYLPQTNAAWANAVDQGVYNGGGVAEGPYVAVSKSGLGKAAFIGDSSPVEDASPKYLREENGQKKTTYDGFKEQNDGKLLVNIINWLSKKESYTQLTQVSGLQLDQPTALLPFEDPAASTEPQSEPWSAPEAGYKWWDSSTFKAGSYGGPAAAVNAAYSLVHQAQLPNAQDFQIRVVADNLPAYGTASGFSAGIYLTGGTQVAQIQNPDGTWPTAYGYSSTFSVTADGLGHGYKDLTVRVKPGTSGAASLRLRQSGNNLKTEAVTLANVPAEPLPTDKPPLPDKISVADARTKADNALVTIEGVVTTEPGAFGGQAFYLQDATGGIYVFQSQSGFHQGDIVSVTAPLAHFNTELELGAPVAIAKTGTTVLPAPKAVTAVNEDNQGQLVELANVTVHNVVSVTPAGSFEFDATAGSVTNHIRVDGRTGLTLDTFLYHEGQVVTVSGVASIFKGVYQLKPRGLSDFAADTTAPTTTAALSSQPNDAGWFNKDVTLTLTAADTGTGVASTLYNNNGSDWTNYSAPITIGSEGTNNLQYYSVDGSGNAEVAQSLQVKLDKTAPAAALTQSGQTVHSVTYDATVQFVLTATDSLSGIVQQKLLLDGVEITSGASLQAKQIGLGSHTVQYSVKDAAGNTAEQIFTFQVTFDTSFSAIHALIEQLGTTGQFKNKGAQDSLEAKLSSAEKQFEKGRTDQAIKHLNDLQETVAKDAAHDKMTALAQEQLTQHISYLLKNGLK